MKHLYKLFGIAIALVAIDVWGLQINVSFDGLPCRQIGARRKEMAQVFAGRFVMITGAARGLGRATANRFLERGAHVAMP